MNLAEVIQLQFAKGHNAETPFECHARITKIILKYSRKYRYYRWRK